MSTPHDPVVKEIADDFDDKGWDVEADHVDGYDTPDKVRGHVPDIYATSGTRKHIVEVETSKDEDEQQRDRFKRWADWNSSRSYEGVLAKSRWRYEVFEEVQ